VSAYVPPVLVEGPGALGRRLYVAQVGRLQDWPDAIAAPAPHFVLFVAADARAVDDAELEEFARKTLEQGAAYLVAWGPDCGRIHLQFDAADINTGRSAEEWIMTEDWADESLDQALWNALFVAWPSGWYESTTKSLLAIAVGNEEWTAAIRRRLADPDQLNEDVVGDE
jgi:hypothetical protein